jgi:RNA polymerase sigma factor (sigma-70 family)
MDKAIIYGGQQITVSIEVADFLKQDDRRLQSKGRSDRRHLSKSDFDTVLSSQQTSNRFALEDLVLKNLRLKSLQKAIATLSKDEQNLIRYYFYEEITMEEIGEIFGMSKSAISKRLKKLYAKMRDLVE